MRLLGDADVNRARVFALRKSHELRNNLKSPTSVERLIYMREMDDIETDDIVNYIVVFSMREITNDAYRDVKVKNPTPPKSDANLEKMEKYQKEVDEYPEKRKAAVEKYMKDRVESLKEALNNRTKEELYKKYEKLLVDEFCEQEALRAYRDMELYLGCYKDPDYVERFFSSFEQYDNLDSKIKSDFRAAYDKLDVRMEDIKKLREATQ